MEDKDYNQEKFSFDDDGFIIDEERNNNKFKSEFRKSFFGPGAFKEEKQKEENTLLGSIFEWLDVIVISVIVVVMIFTFVFRIVAIEGNSMLNTLHDKERVIISDLFYTPKKGDIVVISRNMDNSPNKDEYEQPIIKRIIATEGETVDIDFENGIVYVNGSPIAENYIKEPTYRSGDIEFPVRVKENCVFVLGDNRNDSSDSRFSTIGENGMINEKYILGKAIYRVYPFNKIGGLYKNYIDE